MGLFQPKFCSIFDGHDTFIVGNERRNDVQGGGFTGTGTAGNHDIQLRLYTGPKENGHLLRQGTEGNKIFHGQGGLGEFTDGHTGPDEGQRRDDDVDTGTVRKAGIHQGRCFVHVTANGSDNFIDY